MHLNSLEIGMLTMGFFSPTTSIPSWKENKNNSILGMEKNETKCCHVCHKTYKRNA